MQVSIHTRDLSKVEVEVSKYTKSQFETLTIHFGDADKFTIFLRPGQSEELIKMIASPKLSLEEMDKLPGMEDF
jgi:hypothetical protein